MKLIIALVAAGTLLAGLSTTLFGSHPYTITAYFLSAEGLTPENDVVISGAKVGKVVSVGIAPDDGPSQGGAQVVLQVDGKSAPLHRGTRATIRPKGLLGNPFVELTAGPSGSATIPSGGTLPLQDTASPVTLDQVMDLFDPQTRARIQTLTREGGASLANRGSDLNIFLAALPAITQDTSAVSGKIAQQDQQLSALDVEFDRIAQMMAAEDQAFRRDLANGASLLDVTAAHEEQLLVAFRTHHSRVAFAEGPPDAVYEVGLPAAIGTYYRGDSGCELQMRLVNERLEARKRGGLQHRIRCTHTTVDHLQILVAHALTTRSSSAAAASCASRFDAPLPRAR